LPQYQSRSPEHPEAKKVVVGHGIDLSLWPPRANGADDPHRLLCVHRLSRSKRLELSLEALTLLPAAYTLDIYGIEAEKDYVSEMRALVEKLQLQQRVRFHGTVPLKDLPALYCSHRLILNMASETIDKTMLEALTCGCYPMTTKRNAVAIGIPEAPEEDTPQAIADFIQKHSARAPLSADDMYRVVAERHSLAALVEKMDAFIRPGQ
jgi:glycosyltransferase involved in cell wall biosynthesis